MSSIKNRARNKVASRSHLGIDSVDDVLVATDWRPGRDNLVIEFAVPIVAN